MVLPLRSGPLGLSLVAVQFDGAGLFGEGVGVAAVEAGKLPEQATEHVGREFKDGLRPGVSHLRGIGLQLADEFLEALFGPGGGRGGVSLGL